MGGDDGGAGAVGDAVLEEGAQIPGTLGEFGQVAQGGHRMSAEGGGRSGFEDAYDRGAGLGQAGGHRQQEGPGARHGDPLPGQYALPLEEGLDGSGGEHTRERPAGEGQLAVVGARGDDHRTAAEGAGDVVACGVTGVGRVGGEAFVGAFDMPDRVARTMVEQMVGHQLLPQTPESAPSVVEGAVVAVAVTPVLAARSRSGVDQHRTTAPRRGGDGR